MTINLDELISDREAGTDGPWMWNDQDGYYTLSPGIFISDSPDGTPWGDNIDKANARRIARLPDLEAAYTEAVDAIKTIKSLMEGDFDEAAYALAVDFLESVK